MGRPKRADDGGLSYHVLNRAHPRMTIFEKDGDYEAFERVLQEAVDRTRTRLLAYCVLAYRCQALLLVLDRKDCQAKKNKSVRAKPLIAIPRATQSRRPSSTAPRWRWGPAARSPAGPTRGVPGCPGGTDPGCPGVSRRTDPGCPGVSKGGVQR